MAVTKEYNLRRRFKTKHANFDTQYPSGSDARRRKAQSLTANYEQRLTIMFRSCTEQEKATAAPLRVAWILGKNLKNVH